MSLDEKIQLIEEELRLLHKFCKESGFTPRQIEASAAPFLKKSGGSEPASGGWRGRRVKPLIVLSVAVAVFACLMYIDPVYRTVHLTSRLAAIKLLPLWDWTKINDWECLIDNPLYEGVQLTKEDCEVCRDLTEVDRIVDMNKTEFIDGFLKSENPVLVEDGLRNWPEKLTELTISELSKVYQSHPVLQHFEPCNFNQLTNHASMPLKVLLQKAQYKQMSWYLVHWENCIKEASKAFREFYRRPYFLPQIVEISDTNWVFIAKGDKQQYEELPIPNSLVILMQIKGQLSVRLTPRDPCRKVCHVLDITVNQGEVFQLFVYIVKWILGRCLDDEINLGTIENIDFFLKLKGEGELESLRSDLSEIKEELLKLEEKKSKAIKPDDTITEVKLTKEEEVKQRNKKKKSRFNVPAEQEESSSGAYESDMILSPQELQELQSTRFRRKAVQNEMKLWPGGIIHYEFEQGLDSQVKRTIKDAMRHWEEHTCIRFKPYSAGMSGPSDRIKFSRGSGCRSEIGRRGGAQEIFISDTCKDSMGSLAHEIAHSAGFYHEHSRPDRDEHIKINSQNIKPGFERDFQKLGTRMVNDIEPYDLSSVMHYGPTFFSKDSSSWTLEPRDKKLSLLMGQRDGLSFMDIKTANELYKCSGSCPFVIPCRNGGFIGPNCACVCPPGLTGRDCSEVVQGTTDCGGVFKDKTGVITSPNYPGEYEAESKCHWLIQGPHDSHITLQFDDFEVEQDVDCLWDYVEITMQGLHMGGPRYCGEASGFEHMPKGVFQYPGNALMITLKSDDGYQFRGFKARYTIHT
ncbi:hypothetical protein FSP39_012402 [Pinctada imbricata]|uniref:Metalloendopeptidase n=1 Tax=Pinctada imbricata TaxID=66713 RepID=A0AA88XWK7_PINIB|nr:hypothetical protein FSP39_012402 [Pinctada imbricata]